MTLAAVRSRLAQAGCVDADDEAAILVEAAGTPEELASLVARREAGVPLEHIVGWAEFRGLRLVVDDGVFVPRARSGFLVEQAASAIRCRTRPDRPVLVVDLCCGAGALGAALAAELPQVRLHAADVDPRAVACAELNVAPWGGVAHRGDLFAALPPRLRGRVDVVVSSPPYVPSAKVRLLPSEARDFEPRAALDGGEDGLDVVRRLARGARRWLGRGGCLAVEVGPAQSGTAGALLGGLGYSVRVVSSDEYGSSVVLGTWPG